MSEQENPQRDQPNTYFVQNNSNSEELRRLHIQDQMLTNSMGGVLPEQSDPGTLRRVLDIACGTGGWLIAVTKAYPTIELLMGGDANRMFIEYARAQAETEQLSERVEFHTMDALLLLEAPANYFDLVNLRLSSSFMRTWDWPKLLGEIKRVLRRGGIARITDIDIGVQGTSPALTELYERFKGALYRAGHLFTETPDGLTAHLGRLLTQYGYRQVQTRDIVLEYRAGTPQGEAAYEDSKRFFQNLHPFIRKWGCAGPDYDDLYQQMLSEMRQPDFCGTWHALTAWGACS
jgi:ubiquinone/menaquinone biosynthesis C-methylase UbiE